MSVSHGALTPVADRVAATEKALIDLTNAMYAVFENDWYHTRMMIVEDDVGGFIGKSATFLNPEVEDESQDWANRAGLLEAYRRAVSVLSKNGSIKEI